MNLTLGFSKKYRWPEHYFSVQSLGNPQKLLTTNQFSVSTILFTIMNISFFSLRFDLLSIIAKEVSQIRNNVVCTVACLVFQFCCALTTGHFRKLKEIGVLQLIFPNYVISCDYAFTISYVKIYYFHFNSIICTNK